MFSLDLVHGRVLDLDLDLQDDMVHNQLLDLQDDIVQNRLHDLDLQEDIVQNPLLDLQDDLVQNIPSSIPPLDLVITSSLIHTDPTIRAIVVLSTIGFHLITFVPTSPYDHTIISEARRITIPTCVGRPLQKRMKPRQKIL